MQRDSSNGLKWDKSDRISILGSKAGTLLEEVLEFLLPLLGGAANSPKQLQDGNFFPCSQGVLRVTSGSCMVDPYVGGAQWWKGLRAEGVPGLRFQLIIEDIAWSHTEMSLELEAEDEELQSTLREAIEPVLRGAFLNPNR